MGDLHWPQSEAGQDEQNSVGISSRSLSNCTIGQRNLGSQSWLWRLEYCCQLDTDERAKRVSGHGDIRALEYDERLNLGEYRA